MCKNVPNTGTPNDEDVSYVYIHVCVYIYVYKFYIYIYKKFNESIGNITVIKKINSIVNYYKKITCRVVLQIEF